MSKVLSKDLQKQIQKFIQEHGGYNEIASKMGKTPSSIHAFVATPKNPDPSLPGTKMLAEMALALNCSIDEIIFGRRPQYEVSKNENQPCQECKSKDAIISELKEQLRDQRRDMLEELGKARPTRDQETDPETGSEQKAKTGRGR